jgi:predicted nucleic acid-binding protein
LAPDEFARARPELEDLTPLIDEEGARLVWNDVTELAERFGLTIYDAAYLELAIRREDFRLHREIHR